MNAIVFLTPTLPNALKIVAVLDHSGLLLSSSILVFVFGSFLLDDDDDDNKFDKDIPMGKGLISVIPTDRTRKAVLILAPAKAAPNANDSSELIWYPNSIVGGSKDCISCWIRGIRIPPPNNSMPVIFSVNVILTNANACWMGWMVARWIKSAARLSNCVRDNFVCNGKSS